ncbi:MAG TPA: hypothetical protein VJO72_15525 [Candidatus Dormibacteraeota bacterium]|jgi:hypothetical protein|nr:hypothetical protein [Candidatus Dormibacteraeota bacterium]HYS02377.1 hypothetical protein [Candidatus Eisenbacteria bacterium]
MSLTDAAVYVFGGYVVVIIIAAAFLSLSGGVGEQAAVLAEPEDSGPLVLRQQQGVMPTKPWGFRPPVKHSHYDPAPWQVRPPEGEEDSLENVDRATEIKRELGSEHPPWDRLDRRGL